LRRDELAEARAAFEQTLERLPIHPMARAGLAVLAARAGNAAAPSRAAVRATPASVEAVIARAAVAVLVAGDAGLSRAVTSVEQALAAAPAGNAGWLIPIEPLLGVHLRADAWAPVLARLRTRSA
jgi:hypothetical protein